MSSATDTADHTLHPRHAGVCPPCPADRAEAKDLVKSLEARREAFLRAAEALAAAAEDADVLETFDGHGLPELTAPEVREGWLQSVRDVSYLIDAEKLARLQKLAEG